MAVTDDHQGVLRRITFANWSYLEAAVQNRTKSAGCPCFGLMMIGRLMMRHQVAKVELAFSSLCYSFRKSMSNWHCQCFEFSYEMEFFVRSSTAIFIVEGELKHTRMFKAKYALLNRAVGDCGGLVYWITGKKESNWMRNRRESQLETGSSRTASILIVLLKFTMLTMKTLGYITWI